MTNDELVLRLGGAIENELANIFAKKRTGNSVYMDGSGKPNPSEKRDAHRVLDVLFHYAGLYNQGEHFPKELPMCWHCGRKYEDE